MIRDGKFIPFLMVLMRGYSGSGKSTKAKEVEKRYKQLGYSVHVLSTDDYFTSPSGVYTFDGSKIKQAHEWNQHRTRDHIKSVLNLNVLVSDQHFAKHCVVIDNTCTQKWEMQAYLDIAKQFAYEVYQCVCEGNYKNTHGVPDEAVQRMKDRFEIIDDIPHFKLD